MDGIIGCNGQAGSRIASLHCPGIAVIPALMGFIFLRVFKVAVLYQFGIQSAVGSVVDVFKEDTDEMLADSFLLIGLYGNGGLNGLQSGKTDSILFGAFVVKHATEVLVIGIALHFFDQSIGHALYVAAFFPSADCSLCLGNRKCLGRNMLGAFGRHKITLTLPLQQVGRSGMCHYLTALGGLPRAVPFSIGFTLHQTGTEHLLSTTPRAEVRPYIIITSSHRRPVLTVATPGKFQATLTVGISIRKKVYRVGHIGYSCDSSMQGNASHRQKT